MLEGTVVWLFVMPVASGPVSAIFLILASASVAVAVSMVVLALFDRAFPKRIHPSLRMRPTLRAMSHWVTAQGGLA